MFHPAPDFNSWQNWLQLCLAFAFGYGLGSIPFGLLLTRMAGLGDIRRIGSGNIGTTNVLRTGRKDLAAATLLLDAAKGGVAVLIAAMWGFWPALAAGSGAFIGHLFPVWLRFKGGKGVATYVGILIALSWPAALAFAGVWILIAIATRYSSLSALVGCMAAPIALIALGMPIEAGFFAGLTMVVFVKHRVNIGRLIAGTESKIGSRA